MPTTIHLGGARIYYEEGWHSHDWFRGDSVWIKDDGVYVKILSTTHKVMNFDDISSMPQLDFL